MSQKVIKIIIWLNKIFSFYYVKAYDSRIIILYAKNILLNLEKLEQLNIRTQFYINIITLTTVNYCIQKFVVIFSCKVVKIVS